MLLADNIPFVLAGKKKISEKGKQNVQHGQENLLILPVFYLNRTDYTQIQTSGKGHLSL